MAAPDRLAVLSGHFAPAQEEPEAKSVSRCLTSAASTSSLSFGNVDPDAVGATALPERLSDDSGWNVYRFGHTQLCLCFGAQNAQAHLLKVWCRSNKSPKRIISRFVHDESVTTLHDNLEAAVARYPHVSVYALVSLTRRKRTS